MHNYKILKCLYCDGYEYNCRYYSPFGMERETNPELCVYWAIVDSDLDKITEHKKGDNSHALTFEYLEKILNK